MRIFLLFFTTYIVLRCTSILELRKIHILTFTLRVFSSTFEEGVIINTLDTLGIGCVCTVSMVAVCYCRTGCKIRKKLLKCMKIDTVCFYSCKQVHVQTWRREWY